MSFTNLLHGASNQLSKSDLLCPKLVLISSTLTWAKTGFNLGHSRLDGISGRDVQAKWKSCNAV